jgi:uncharacterized membrane protein YkgB
VPSVQPSDFLTSFDKRFRGFMARWGVPALRAALAIVFIWFGALKLIDESPARDLIEDAFPFMPYPEFLYLLGSWEVAIGVGLAAPLFPIGSRTAGVITRITLALLWIQLAGTFLPVVLEPDAVFDGYPPLLTLTGEFIAKNLVLATAGLVIGATVHVPGEPSPLPGTIREAMGREAVR